MTVKELIKLLKKYPDQNMEIRLSDSENGDMEPSGLEDQKYWVGCTHDPKFDHRGLPIPGSGTFEHNESCHLEICYVVLEW